MKPFSIVLLMGAAALGGGLVVRYSDHPVEITMGHAAPPNVVAPPVAPAVHVGASSPVSARPPIKERTAIASARHDSPVPAEEPAKATPAKPSALSERVHIGKPDRPAPPPAPAPAAETRIVARVKIPPEPPAITPLEHSKAPVQPPAAAPVIKEAAPVIKEVSPVKEIAKASEPAPSTANAITSNALTSKPAPASSVPATQASTEQPNHATLPAGMLISVRIREALSSNLNSKGDVFSGTLDKAIVADGFVIAERGARVRGEVIESKSDGSAPELAVRLREIQASDGQRVHIVSEAWRKQGTQTAANLPARSSNNVYDAPLTRNNAAVIRPATSITFRLDQAVELTERR